MDTFKNAVFDMPKRPINVYALYVKDKLNDLKQKYKNSEYKFLIKKVSEQWQNENKATQMKYLKLFETDKERFKNQLKQFEKLGYYIKTDLTNKSETSTKDENDEKNISFSEKRKSVTKKRTTIKSTKRGTKKTKSKGKTTKKRELNRSRIKNGKTQKKKK